MDDITKFQQSYVKGKNFNVVLIGSKDKIDFKSLQRYGQVRELTLDEIFGYEKVERINLEAGN
jgi:zinc protease